LIIAGIMMLPIAATVAAEEPVSAPKKAEVTTATMASPPYILPNRTLARSMSLFEIPPRSITRPASIKNGMAMIVKESVAVK
jgi:hypothetical protein